MYSYHQPWTIWTAVLSDVYVHKRESFVGIVSKPGVDHSTQDPDGLRAIQLRPLLVWTIRRLMGSKFASV